MTRVMHDMHMQQVTIAYGMTETSPVSWQSRVDDEVSLRCSTVGRIHPHVECKIVNQDGGTCAIDESGEVWTRGYLVMKGYYGNEQQTKDTITEDGWVKTGDVGYIDQQGHLTISGRIKDVVIRGGENLFPAEIENYLLALDEVTQAEVVGVRDSKYGEALCAFVVPSNKHKGLDSTEMCETIRTQLKGKIAHFKIPQHVIVRETLDDVKTVTGKTMKFLLRDMAHEILGL